MLWCDEMNWLVAGAEQEALTQSVGRQFRLITVALAQNLPLL